MSNGTTAIAHRDTEEQIDPRENALVRQQTAGIITAVASDQLVHAVREYKRIQEALDSAMPDCIMWIQKRQFRKKQYWRGVRMAFNLEVICVGEERIELADGDWGYTATYRATAPNGSTADGDGACMATEKEVRDRDTGEIIAWKTKQAQTVHNVRSHAHTRAMNRAISNLVGFGEVSAEEATDDDDHPPRRDVTPRGKAKWTAEEEDEFYARAAEYGVPDRLALLSWLKAGKHPRPEDMTPAKREECLGVLAKNYAKKMALAAGANEEPPPSEG